MDKPLHKYYADHPNEGFGPPHMPKDKNYTRLTARILLSHQARLPNEFIFEKPQSFKYKKAPRENEEEKFYYSGEAYRFLRDVVEKLTQKSLENLAQEEFSKIGMTNTSFMPPTHCSLIRLKDEDILTPARIKKLLEKESDVHCRSNIIYHQDKLFIAERDDEGNIHLTPEKQASSEEDSVFQAIKKRFSTIPPFLWSTAIPIEARELPMATDFLGHALFNTTNFALGHYDNGSVNTDQRFYVTHPAGSLYTTASDYAKFLNACMTDPYVKREMFTPTPTDTSLKGRDKKAMRNGVPPEILDRISWGTGIGIQTNDNGERIAFHWGDNGTSRNFAAINLIPHGHESPRAVVCLTNSRNGSAVFESVAEPVVGSIQPICQWLALRENLPMQPTIQEDSKSQIIKERYIQQKNRI